jgi:hypothetical protein
VTGSAPTRVSAGGLRGAAGSLIGYAARIPRGGGLPIADALAVGSRAAGRPEGGGQRRPTRPALGAKCAILYRPFRSTSASFPNRSGRGGTDSTPCPAGHLFRNRLIVAVAANRSVSPRGSAALVPVSLRNSGSRRRTVSPDLVTSKCRPDWRCARSCYATNLNPTTAK